MKKLSIIIITIVSIFFMYSCEEEAVGPVIKQNPNAPELSSPQAGQSIVLTQEAADSIVVTLEWNEPDYGFSSATKYNVSMAESGTEFAEPINLGSADTTMFELTVGDLNNKLLTAGYTPGESVSMDMRVSASVSDSVENLLSEPVTIEFTPYEVVIDYPKLWVPGGYQGWAPDAAPNLFSIEDNDIYTGYIHLPSDAESLEFKFTSHPDWSHTNYGSAGEGELSTDPGAGNLSVDETGTYYMTANINELTWENELRNFALIGSFNDWSDDEPLTWNSEDQVFTVTLDLDAGAEFKWRANSAWDFDLGLSGEGDNTLAKGGSNLSVEEAGNYTIILDLYQPVPEYQIIKN